MSKLTSPVSSLSFILFHLILSTVHPPLCSYFVFIQHFHPKRQDLWNFNTLSVFFCEVFCVTSVYHFEIYLRYILCDLSSQIKIRSINFPQSSRKVYIFSISNLLNFGVTIPLVLHTIIRFKFRFFFLMFCSTSFLFLF